MTRRRHFNIFRKKQGKRRRKVCRFLYYAMKANRRAKKYDDMFRGDENRTFLAQNERKKAGKLYLKSWALIVEIQRAHVHYMFQDFIGRYS